MTEPRPPRLGPAFQGDEALTMSQAEDRLLESLASLEETPSEESAEDADAETLPDHEPEENQGTEASASDDGLTDEEIEGEILEPEGPPVFEIPWGDEGVRHMTAEEIRSGHMARQDYDRKQAERARAEESAVAREQAAQAKATALDGLLTEIARFKEEGLPVAPPIEMAETDPGEYVKLDAQYRAKMKVLEQAEQKAKEAQAEQLQSLKRENAKRLLDAIPQWKDPEVQQRELTAISQMGAQSGWWTPDMFDAEISTVPYWQIEAWRDALLYRRSKARTNGKGAAPTKRVVKRTPTVRSQASQPQSSKGQAAAEAANNRFMKTRTNAAAEEFLLARLEQRGARYRRA